MNKSKYKRVLLKISGEALMGKKTFGISRDMLEYVVNELKQLAEAGLEMGLVVGAGNIFRGVAGASQGMDRTVGDNMGMLATVINSLAMQDAMERMGLPARVLSAVPLGGMCEPFSTRRAMRHLENNKVVIFAGGTGNPYFTTDTAAVLRGLEINADVIIKCTRVDGVYDKDPLLHPEAVKFNTLSYSEVLRQGLKVMDAAAISLAKDNDKPVVVLNMNVPGNISKIIYGQQVGTLVSRG